MEATPVSETSCFGKKLDDGQSPKTMKIMSLSSSFTKKWPVVITF
jgi:hypothetical protein